MSECSKCSDPKNIISKKKIEKGEVKEDFICAACVGVGLAVVGVGSTSVGSTLSKQKFKKTKKIMFWVGIISIVLSVAFFVWAVIPAKYGGCKACKL
jgi:ABC-type uncharacterized transport system permease subunit